MENLIYPSIPALITTAGHIITQIKEGGQAECHGDDISYEVSWGLSLCCFSSSFVPAIPHTTNRPWDLQKKGKHQKKQRITAYSMIVELLERITSKCLSGWSLQIRCLISKKRERTDRMGNLDSVASAFSCSSWNSSNEMRSELRKTEHIFLCQFVKEELFLS